MKSSRLFSALGGLSSVYLVVVLMEATGVVLSLQAADWTGAGGSSWGEAGNWVSGDIADALGEGAIFDAALSVEADLLGRSFLFGGGANSLRFHNGGLFDIVDSVGGGELTVDVFDATGNNTVNAEDGIIASIDVPLRFRNTGAGADPLFAGAFRLRAGGESTLRVLGDVVSEVSIDVRTLDAGGAVRLDGDITLEGDGRGVEIAVNAGFVRLNALLSSAPAAIGNHLLAGAGDVRLAPGAGIDASIEELRLSGGVNFNHQNEAHDVVKSAVVVEGAATYDLFNASNTVTGALRFSGPHTLAVDFSDAAGSDLAFADSSAVAWDAGAVLDLVGFHFAEDSLRFGTDANGLTAQQLSQIRFNGQQAEFELDADGYLKRASADLPNIVIIFTDDHGFTDLGIHGVDANVRTPNMDALAAGGALMRHGYSTSPQCVPSRAGILTGRIQNTFGTRQNGDIWGRTPIPLEVPTLAERIDALGGYATGMVGKWHVSPPGTIDESEFPGTRDDYEPGNRGFQEYWNGSLSPYDANFALDGGSLTPPGRVDDPRNRVLVQGEAGEAFIQRNQNQPFFLYLALYGPHLPRMDKTDAYYVDFPELDYPQYSDEMDDIRRLGLGLVWAIDDAVGGVVEKLRELGLEENTLILFAGDNGAQPKFWDGVPGSGTLEKWTGNENIPLRGEKGSLWEGGIKVPMFAYWKGTIPAGQLIDDPVWTLDFTATALKLAGGAIPDEFDGVDILPLLKGDVAGLEREDPMFWDWGDQIVIRKGDWKLLRTGIRRHLFNLAEDPYELFDLKYDEPAKFAELEAELMAWYHALPADGQSPLKENAEDWYELGAPAAYVPDDRFVIPYSGGAPAAYPAPLTTLNDPNADSDGDGKTDGQEDAAGRDKNDASDLAFEFNGDDDLEGWQEMGFIDSHAVGGGMLEGQAVSGQGKFEFHDFHFEGADIENMLVRVFSPTGEQLAFRWGIADDDTFQAGRTLLVPYQPNVWNTVVVPLKGEAEWSERTITRMRLNPVDREAAFQVDWIRASTGDYDADLLPDGIEFDDRLDAADPADGNADGDGDGRTRGEEWLLGSSDADGASVFRVDLTNSTGPALSFDGLAGRNYRIYRSYTLTGDWTIVHETGTLAADAAIPFSDHDSDGKDEAFYKVRVIQGDFPQP